tara:strand:+ start:509 stop:970 length:462 start_codon:yes stop_codon:yes gene_type:complete
MFFKIKNHFFILYILVCLFFSACQLKEPRKNHGILFLKNRSDTLEVNKSNKNDILKIIGQPHTTSINDDDVWIYFERVLTKGKYHKLGKNILKTNNILIVRFNKFGILAEKKFYDKNSREAIEFSDKYTENDLSKRSFMEKFLNSLKNKMYKR